MPLSKKQLIANRLAPIDYLNICNFNLRQNHYKTEWTIVKNDKTNPFPPTFKQTGTPVEDHDMGMALPPVYSISPKTMSLLFVIGAASGASFTN